MGEAAGDDCGEGLGLMLRVSCIDERVPQFRSLRLSLWVGAMRCDSPRSSSAGVQGVQGISLMVAREELHGWGFLVTRRRVRHFALMLGKKDGFPSRLTVAEAAAINQSIN